MKKQRTRLEIHIEKRFLMPAIREGEQESGQDARAALFNVHAAKKRNILALLDNYGGDLLLDSDEKLRPLMEDFETAVKETMLQLQKEGKISSLQTISNESGRTYIASNAQETVCFSIQAAPWHIWFGSPEEPAIKARLEAVGAQTAKPGISSPSP